LKSRCQEAYLVRVSKEQKEKSVKFKIKPILYTIILLTILSCGNPTETAEAPPKKVPSFEVEYAGALKNFMHKGDVSAKVTLSEYEEVEHLYALGAVENLKGEIQIFDGRPANSFVENGMMKFDSSYGKKAALFVAAVVEEWGAFQVPDEIITKKEFEGFVAKTASENGIDVSKPFPFLMEGVVKEADWHVINWKDGDMEHSHEKHIASGLNGRVVDAAVEMLGFYSDSHHAVFTHHTTNMHIHMRLADETIAGHVDDLKLGRNMMLKLPK
jgi:acetolactate decarboxylase